MCGASNGHPERSALSQPSLDPRHKHLKEDLHCQHCSPTSGGPQTLQSRKELSSHPSLIPALRAREQTERDAV